MSGIDLDNLSFKEVDSFYFDKSARGSIVKTLADGNTITAVAGEGDRVTYSVTDPTGAQLKAMLLKLQSGAVGETKCQVCYTTPSGQYICVNVLCGAGTTIQTASE
jgi:hypothetical protein